MSERLIAQRSTRASVVLFAGNLVSTALLAVSSIVIARLLGPSLYGSYTLVLVIPQLLQLFVGLGVTSAITRYSAYNIARGDVEGARRVSVNGMVFLLLFGAALSVVCYAGADLLSASVIHRAGLAPLVRLVSFAVLAQTALQASVAGLVGWNATGVASFGSILQAALRLSIAPALVVSGFGVVGALDGFTAGYLVAGGVTSLAFYALKLRGSIRRASASRFVADVRETVSYGLPVYGGLVLTGGANYYVTILVAAIAANSVVGNYQAANNITAAYSLALAAITLALLPAFSSLYGTGADTGLAFRQATKYVAYIMAPFTLFIAGCSGPIVRLLYGQAFAPAGTYLLLLAISDIPLVVGFNVASAFFNGIGKTRFSLAVSAVAAFSLFVAAPLMGGALGLGVNGLIYAQIASNSLSAAACIYIASRHLRATIDMRSLLGVFAASVAGYVVVALLATREMGDLASLLVEAAAFFLTYFTLAPLVRAVDSSDLDSLGEAMSGAGILSGLLRQVLRYERLVISLARQKRGTPTSSP